jgi:hypothetical protein
LTVRVEWDDGRFAIYRFIEVEGEWKQSDQAGAEFEMPVPTKSAADIPFKTSQFTFVRIKHSAHDRGPGAWAVDYPDAELNFSAQVEQLTGLTTDADGHILELTDSTLGLYPFIYIVEGGSLRLSDDEVAALRSYLLGGGFLMVDDFWGEDDWALLSAEFRRVFPEREPVELPADHEIFQSFYHIDEKPQVPSLIAVMRDDGEGESAEETYYRGLIGNDGRLMAIFCHNADFGDAWEYADRPEYPREISFGRAIPMGINIVVYALSH